MGAMRAALWAAVLLISVSTPVPVRAASDCGFAVEFAELLAIGTTHREALYLISVYSHDQTNNPRFPAGYHFIAGTDGGATTALDEQGTTPSDNGWGSAMFLVVLPAPGVRWFNLDSVAVDGKSTICADDRYILPQALYSTDGNFDDTVTAQTPLPLIVYFQPPPFVHKAQPDYPVSARVNNLQGEVSVAVTIDATGKTTDATVVSSSGYQSLDDAAANAARASGFGTPMLPAALGGKPIAMRLVIIYTFSLDE